MCQFIVALFFHFHAFVRSHHQLGLEILALRQQVVVLERKRPRPRLRKWDRLFLVALRGLWSRWSTALVIVKPETVVGWHRAGSRPFWRWRSRARKIGRPRLNAEVRILIRRMARENPTWGAPRIHGELLLLGFEVSERSVSRYLIRLRWPDGARQPWRAFLRNHRDAIAALDFFTVPTASFRLLYGLFVIEHGRRRIPHFNVTAHPTSEWIMQQLRKAFSDSPPCRYGIMDRDSKFNGEHQQRRLRLQELQKLLHESQNAMFVGSLAIRGCPRLWRRAKDLNGGRERTRTFDLLRVKQAL